MDIAESFYKGVVETSYKNRTREDSNHADHSSNKRGEVSSLQTHPKTGESASKHRKRYLDCLLVKSNTCLIIDYTGDRKRL